MGQRDNAQNDYFKDKIRFADACNGILFHGREVIRPEELQEADPAIIYYDEKEQLQKVIPDKVCMWKGMIISILGLETQTNVDYSMVLRNMKTEAISYQKQWLEREKEYRRSGLLGDGEKFEWSELGKKSKIVPVIMIVVYFGTDKAWDGARSLCDMLDWDKELEPYITNYKLNLFDYHEYDDFSFFKTENRLIFETLACSCSKRKMKTFMISKIKEYENLDMTSKMLLCDLIGFKNNLRVKEMIKGGIGMCKAIREWEEEAIEIGKEIGKEEMLDTMINNLMDSLKVSVQEAKRILQISESGDIKNPA